MQSVDGAFINLCTYGKIQEILRETPSFDFKKEMWKSTVTRELKLLEEKDDFKKFEISRIGDTLVGFWFEIKLKSNPTSFIKNFAHNLFKCINITTQESVSTLDQILNLSNITFDFTTNFGMSQNKYKSYIKLINFEENDSEKTLILPIIFPNEIPVVSLPFNRLIIECLLNYDVEMRCFGNYKIYSGSNRREMARLSHNIILNNYKTIINFISDSELIIPIKENVVVKSWLFGIKENDKFSSYKRDSIKNLKIICDNSVLFEANKHQLEICPFFDNIEVGDEPIYYYSPHLPVDIGQLRDLKVCVNFESDCIGNCEFVIVLETYSILEIKNGLYKVINNSGISQVIFNI